MSFQLRHTWTVGALVNGRRLSFCSHCEITRSADPSDEKRAVFIRAIPENRPQHNRIVEVEPPCISPPWIRYPKRKDPLSELERARRAETEAGSLKPGQQCPECMRSYGGGEPCQVCAWVDA